MTSPQPHTAGIITESAVSDNRGLLPTTGIDRGKPSSFRKKVSRASSFRKQRSIKGRKNVEAGGGRYSAGIEDNKIIPDIPGDIERKISLILKAYCDTLFHIILYFKRTPPMLLRLNSVFSKDQWTVPIYSLYPRRFSQ